MRVNYCTRLAQLGATFCSSNFLLLWNSGSVVDCVFRKWLFLRKILIWLENVIRVYCCTPVAQLSTTFCSSKFPILWISGSVMDYVFWKWVFIWKILIWLENVIRLYCCTRLAQLSTTYCSSKFLFLKNPGSLMYCVFRKWVFIWKILMWLESFMMFYYCTRLALRRTTFF